MVIERTVLALTLSLKQSSVVWKIDAGQCGEVEFYVHGQTMRFDRV